MDEQSTTSPEERLSNAPMPPEATPNPMEAVMNELAELRKVNQKLNERLDNLANPKAKKKLFNESKRSSVDPSCSVSIFCNDLIALGNVATNFYLPHSHISLTCARLTRCKLHHCGGP